MKKILFAILLTLSFTGSAFAAAVALATHTPTTNPGSTIRGGSTLANATAAPTPLIKFSTGVHGIVNYLESTSSPGTAAGYTIGTRHVSGSKDFVAMNSRTNILWRQASKITATNTIAIAMAAEFAATIDDAFSVSANWTSY